MLKDRRNGSNFTGNSRRMTTPYKNTTAIVVEGGWNATNATKKW